jgi:hypothetical protein
MSVITELTAMRASNPKPLKYKNVKYLSSLILNIFNNTIIHIIKEFHHHQLRKQAGF